MQLLVKRVPRCITNNPVHGTNCCQEHDSHTQHDVARVEPERPGTPGWLLDNKPNETGKPERGGCKPNRAEEAHQVCKQHVDRLQMQVHAAWHALVSFSLQVTKQGEGGGEGGLQGVLDTRWASSAVYTAAVHLQHTTQQAGALTVDARVLSGVLNTHQSQPAASIYKCEGR